MSPARGIQAPATKRKIRKGTFSCWECKRRKTRCIFPPNHAKCSGCLQRKAKCVSQEYPDEIILPYTEGDGVESSPAHSKTRFITTVGLPASSPVVSDHARDVIFSKSESRVLDIETHIASRGNDERISEALYKALPSRKDIEMLCTGSIHNSVLTHELLTTPYKVLELNGLKPATKLLDIPESNTHPVLIARYMLQLTMFLQQFHPDLLKQIDGLSESSRAITERLTDVAVRLVTTNDELLGSIEGLECVMIESVYQAKIGNLRRSWVANRRAMAIAQLMGLNRSDNRPQYKILDHNTSYYPETMWLRILFMDQYLCLMLGLSQGSSDRGMASEMLLTEDTPLGRLERIHCVVASRVLERNESTPSPDDLELTRALDVELQQAARRLPTKWWLPPDLVNSVTDSGTRFWDMLRLFAQFHHYNLLNQLHLPYMLRSSSTDRKYEYSLITCVNASREVLSRFITLNSFSKVTYSCRKVDFLALMAAMTLLIAYLAGTQHANGQNLLAHQYLSDRAMIEKTQETMEVSSQIYSDALSAQSAKLLRRLLTLKIEPESFSSHEGGRVTVQEADNDTVGPDQDDDAVVTVQIPYFGTVKIAREGVCKAPLPPPPRITSTSQYIPLTDSGYDSLDVSPTRDVDKEIQARCSAQLQNTLSDPLCEYGEFPGLVARGEDWAFQGVDMAFFESLMRTDEDWASGIDVNMNNTR